MSAESNHIEVESDFAASRPDGFFLQINPLLNEREAWTATQFPQAHYHYFKDSGCVVTSLWNMCLCYQMPNFQSDFPTPWELNEAFKANEMFYENANIELGYINRVLPIEYLDRFAFKEDALKEQLRCGTMCLLRASGQNGRYHYILPQRSDGGELRCFDPKTGYTHLGDYEKIHQIIRFGKLWQQNSKIW